MIQRMLLEWHYSMESKLTHMVYSRTINNCRINKCSNRNTSLEFHTKQRQKFSTLELIFSVINNNNNNRPRFSNNSYCFNLQRTFFLYKQLVDKIWIIIVTAARTTIMPIILYNSNRNNSNNSHRKPPLLILRFQHSNNLEIFDHPNYHSNH